MALPIFLKNNSKCLLIGNNTATLAKLRILLQNNIITTLQADNPCEQLILYCEQFKVEFKEQPLTSIIAKHNYNIVIDASLDSKVNEFWHRQSIENNFLLNCVDSLNYGNFQFGAIVKRGFVTAAFNSGGKLPALSTYLRYKFEQILPNATKLENLAKFKGIVNSKIKVNSQRTKFWQTVFDNDDVLNNIDNDDNILHLINNINSKSQVAIIGAGPGDPNLLTIKAHKLLASADYVLHDRLINPKLLELTRRDAQLILVGKGGTIASTKQKTIEKLLLKLSSKNSNVVRLKGGDPFTFGRGGEELEALKSANINCVVVPGITSAHGCASYCGIPLTHRKYATSVRFITAHRSNNSFNFSLEPNCLDKQTLVFFMGVAAIPTICQRLNDLNISSHTAIAIIENGTLPNQKLTLTNLKLLEKIASSTFKAPAIIIIGDVVTTHRNYDADKTAVFSCRDALN